MQLSRNNSTTAIKNFFLFFYYCIVLLEFLPWEIRVAFPGESQLRQSRATQPTVHAGSVFPNPPNSGMDYRISNVRTDVNACDCTPGCTDIVRESALKVDSERKIPCRAGESNLRRRRAGPMLHQLNYIRNQKTVSAGNPTFLVCLPTEEGVYFRQRKGYIACYLISSAHSTMNVISLNGHNKAQLIQAWGGGVA